MTLFIWTILKPTAEIIILWIVYYRILKFFEGTRAFQVLKGISYLLLVFLVSQLLGFTTLNWLLTKFFGISIIALVIIFQQELRQGLARLGQQHFFNVGLEETEINELIQDLTDAIYRMARNRVGGLVAIEKEMRLNTYIESGVGIDGKLSSELLQNIFVPNSPMHDGGVIVRGQRIVAASCLFPLSENPNFSKIIGTRHRAALGLTEQTDAIVIVVSEETGDISLACEGRFIPITNQERLINMLKNLIVSRADTKETKTKGKAKS